VAHIAHSEPAADKKPTLDEGYLMEPDNRKYDDHDKREHSDKRKKTPFCPLDILHPHIIQHACLLFYGLGIGPLRGCSQGDQEEGGTEEPYGWEEKSVDE